MAQQNDLVAVLVDANNVSPARIGAVMTEIAQYGTASVKRASLWLSEEALMARRAQG
ncbi:hypothetical protein [Microbacterium hibisci]|uniref:hypothetical protein n=1 Tax=Microbacterium hibisci TaxID=2036000 RepID=UPI00194392FE|nr:hypothetical protein [Microbacterium hibisci]